MRTEVSLELLNHLHDGNGEIHQRINERMLEGVPFEEAAREIAPRRALSDLKRTFTRSEIIEENRMNFEEIGADRQLPYRRIMEMMNAKTIRKAERVIQKVVIVNGERQIVEDVVEVSEEVDDWPNIMQAIKQYCIMNGLDPKAGLVSVEQKHDGTVNINVGHFFQLAKNITSEDDRLAYYAEIKRMERQGILPRGNQDVIEGEVIKHG